MQLIALLLALQETQETPKLEKYAPSKPMVGVVDVLLNFYDQDDSGGNPNQKEDVSIFQPMMLVNFKLSEEWNVTLTMQSDLIMTRSDSASGASGRAAGGTAAAGNGGEEDEDEGGGEAGGLEISEVQFGGSLSFDFAWSRQTHVGAGFSLSKEDNYRSLGGFVKWSYETEDRNDAFGVRLTALSDTVELDYFDGTSGGEDGRVTFSPGASWTHVLGGATLLTVAYDLTVQRGELGTPAQSVISGGTEVREVLPDSRIRHAVHARLRHLLFDVLSVEPGLSLYADSWGARAWAFEFALYLELVPGAFLLRPSYRFHSQTEIDAFLDEGQGIPEFRTQDSDLGAFTTSSFGVKLSFFDSPLFGDELEIVGEYSDRSDGIEWFTIAVGFRWK